MRKLICTTYNELKDGSLQLRNTWVDDVLNEGHLLELLDSYGVSNQKAVPNPSFKGVSEIIVGEFDLPDTQIHIRVVQ